MDTHTAIPAPVLELLPLPTPLPPVASLLAEHFIQVLEPATLRDSWATSRVGVTATGELCSVLGLLARTRYGPFDDTVWLAYWADRNWRNESWDNVLVARRRVHGPRQARPYGAPADTAKYRRAYYAANKARFQAAHARHRAKRAARLQELQDVERQFLAQMLGASPETPSPGEDEFLASLLTPPPSA